MSQEENVRSILASSAVSQLPIRDRVGLVIQATDVATAITRICEAEQAGVQQVWQRWMMPLVPLRVLKKPDVVPV